MRWLALLLTVSTVPASAQSTGKLLAYVGTYSSPAGPEGSHGNGQGIYIFQVDPASGAVFLPTAKYGPAPAGGRGAVLPGTFQILVVTPGG